MLGDELQFLPGHEPPDIQLVVGRREHAALVRLFGHLFRVAYDKAAAQSEAHENVIPETRGVSVRGENRGGRNLGLLTVPFGEWPG